MYCKCVGYVRVVSGVFSLCNVCFGCVSSVLAVPSMCCCVRYVMSVSVVLSVCDMLWLFSDAFCVCRICYGCVSCVLSVSDILWL